MTPTIPDLIRDAEVARSMDDVLRVIDRLPRICEDERVEELARILSKAIRRVSGG